MPSEWYKNDFSTDLEDHEMKLIEEGIPQLTSIVGSAFENLEDYDQDGGEVTIYNEGNQSTGIKITHAIYGDPQFQSEKGINKQEQLHRITIGDEYVTILFNPDVSIKEIQTNIQIDSPYTVYTWLNNAYSQIYNILNNPKDYYFKRKGFQYHGEEESRRILNLKKSLHRH